MTEQELRALVRSIVAARLAPGETGAHGAGSSSSSPISYVASATARVVAAPGSPSAHAELRLSHGRFTLAPDPDGHCFIEPGVACNHCGFCESYGH